MPNSAKVQKIKTVVIDKDGVQNQGGGPDMQPIMVHISPITCSTSTVYERGSRSDTAEHCKEKKKDKCTATNNFICNQINNHRLQ